MSVSHGEHAHLLAAAFASSSERFVSLVWFSSSGFPFIPPPSFSGQSLLFFCPFFLFFPWAQEESAVLLWAGKWKRNGSRAGGGSFSEIGFQQKLIRQLACAKSRERFHFIQRFAGIEVILQQHRHNKIPSLPVYVFINSLLRMSCSTIPVAHTIPPVILCLFLLMSRFCRRCWNLIMLGKWLARFPKLKKKAPEHLLVSLSCKMLRLRPGWQPGSELVFISGTFTAARAAVQGWP